MIPVLPLLSLGLQLLHAGADGGWDSSFVIALIPSGHAV